MDRICTVDRRNPMAHPVENAKGEIDRGRTTALGQPLAQGDPAHVFHHEVRRPVLLTVGVDLDDIRMTDARHGAGLVGAGSMGVVLLARDESLDRRVAIKWTRAPLPSGRFRESLVSEAASNGRLVLKRVIAW